MSAGEFTTSRYEAGADNGGGIYSIRVQPETLALALGGTDNDPPAGAANQPIATRARKSAREYGVGARAVQLRFTAAAPAGYSGDEVTVPIMTPDLFAAAVPKTVGVYLAVPVEVVSRIPERFR